MLDILERRLLSTDLLYPSIDLQASRLESSISSKIDLVEFDLLLIEVVELYRIRICVVKSRPKFRVRQNQIDSTLECASRWHLEIGHYPRRSS